MKATSLYGVRETDLIELALAQLGPALKAKRVATPPNSRGYSDPRVTKQSPRGACWAMTLETGDLEPNFLAVGAVDDSSSVLVGYFCDGTGEDTPEATAVLFTSGCSQVFVDNQSSLGTELKGR